MPYIVETRFLNTWENCWSDGEGEPAYFPSMASAYKAIAEHINDCMDAVSRGDMVDYPSADDFRLIEISAPAVEKKKAPVVMVEQAVIRKAERLEAVKEIGIGLFLVVAGVGALYLILTIIAKVPV